MVESHIDREGKEPIALSDNKRDRTATKHIPYNKN